MTPNAPDGVLMGQVIRGGKPLADQEVGFLPVLAPLIGWESLPGVEEILYKSAKTDEHGKFVFKHLHEGSGVVFLPIYKSGQTNEDGKFVLEHLPAWKGAVLLPIVAKLGSGNTQRLQCWSKTCAIKPGGVTEVILGGTGRAIVGKVVVDGMAEGAIDWTKNQPIEIDFQPEAGEPQIWPPRNAGPLPYAKYAAKLDREGRFRIDDVPYGKYQLHFVVTRPLDPKVRSEFTEIGRATLTFGLPEPISGREKEPFDLGTIKAVLDPTLQVGARVPRLTALLSDGKPLPATATQGKVTLVVFWSPGFPPSYADLQTWKEIHKAFGNNPRFAMVGVVCEASADVPERAVRRHSLTWPQLLGGISGAAAVGYSIREIPTVLLLGPDGSVLAKNANGAKLLESVRKALSDEKLFANPNAMWLEAFPVKRFNPEPMPESPAKSDRACPHRGRTPGNYWSDKFPSYSRRHAPHHETVPTASVDRSRPGTPTAFRSRCGRDHQWSRVSHRCGTWAWLPGWRSFCQARRFHRPFGPQTMGN